MERPFTCVTFLIFLVQLVIALNQTAFGLRASPRTVPQGPPHPTTFTQSPPPPPPSTSPRDSRNSLVAPVEGYVRPSLIGFRLESVSEFTLEGIAIVEANTPVKLTLFGESFTTETIVGFTTELVARPKDSNDDSSSWTWSSSQTQRPDQLKAINGASDDKPVAGHAVDSISELVQHARSHNLSTLALPAPAATPREQQPDSHSNSTSSRTNYHRRTILFEGAHRASAPMESKQTDSEIRDRKFRRRLLDRKSHDCTDFDRIISYKLTEENLITPNVAVLNVRLPELDVGTSSGKYYYICLKQPLEPTPSTSLVTQAESLSSNTFEYDDESTSQAPANALRGMALSGASKPISCNLSVSLPHVWIHQGDEWWLTIKVEPPILSIANDCILIGVLLFLSAVTSGLNLGLMSLDMNELAVISSCGDPRERSYARTIAPLRKRGNYLLCSLLLGNVMVNSTLTVILEEMTSGVVAVIGSTLAIVVLGEIVPQAFCARQGLAIGAKTIYLTYAFMIITFPLSYPIACLLDCILGEEKGNVYDRERLMEFIRITGNHTQLEADEVAIISGALKLKKIKVDQIMTKIEDVFMLPLDCMLDRKTIRSIIEKGYSRIPVYECGDRKQIAALILAKDLALLDPDDQMPLASMLKYCKHPLIFIEDTATLDVALNEFKTGKSHMAIVRQLFDDGEVDKYYEAIGVVTLEDVIEEVLQTEINDETDTLSDNRRKRRRTEAQVAHLVDELISTAAVNNLSKINNTIVPSTKF